MTPTLFSNKRASTVSISVSLIAARLVIAALAILLPIALLATFTPTSIDTHQLETTILIHQLLYSPHGLGVFDAETQQAPLGIIDASKLEAASASSSYLSGISRYPQPRMAAKLTVGILQAYYNKGLYDDYYPLGQSALSGKGGADITTYTLPLLIRHQETDTPATAIIQVVTPR